MFEQEIVLNQFLMEGFGSIVADIPADRCLERAPGNGHPPIWVLGHLAICSELGEMLCGGNLTHPEWLPVFGPGSSDDIAVSDQFSKDDLVQEIVTGYPRMAEMARNVDPVAMEKPHEVELLLGSPIVTVGQLVSHLLSSHFAFHQAQLSAWRRAAGFGPLF